MIFGFLIRSSIRTYRKDRKCSFLTGLIILLTDLLQANHQGWIGKLKKKFTGSPCRTAPIASLILLFRAFRFSPRPSPEACSQAKLGHTVQPLLTATSHNDHLSTASSVSFVSVVRIALTCILISQQWHPLHNR